MSKTIRMLLLGLVGAFALSSAGTALAAYTSPSLRVTDDRTSTTIRYTVSGDRRPDREAHVLRTDRVLGVAGPGRRHDARHGHRAGDGSRPGRRRAPADRHRPGRGPRTARITSGTRQVSRSPLTAGATQCTGTATHTAFWVLILQAAGQTLELPVFVDAPAAPPAPGASASAFASSSIQACLPPPDVPTGTPGRATFGFKLTQVDFKVNGVFTSAGTGQPRWRTLATPYTPNTGRPNAAGSVEVQSVIAFPRTLTLSRPTLRSANGFTTLALRGVQQLPAGAASTIRLYRGRTPAGLSPSVPLVKVGPAFRGTLRIRQTANRQIVFLQARATVSAGTTTCTPTFGVPCLNATRAAVAVRSGAVRVVIPARRR